MDWIEQWFGLNPDGGSGSIEAAILAAVALTIVAGVVCGSSKLRARALRALRSLVTPRRA